MSIAFAIIEHKQNYYDFYDELLGYIKENFSQIESGIQGDAWIWVKNNQQIVAIDTFYSMQFEINSDNENELLLSVIEIIKKRYPVRIYDAPIER